MALVHSLLSAIVRANGDALVMHVGERPYVVVGTSTINISTHGLNLEAMTGMLTQLLPADAHIQLEEFGAVEHRIPQEGGDRFSVVAARGGDDIWIEIRRRRARPVASSEPVAPPVAAVAEPVPVAAAQAESTPAAIVPLTEREPIDEPVYAHEPEPLPEPMVAQSMAPPDPDQAPPAVEIPTAVEEAPAGDLAARLEPPAEPVPVIELVAEPEPEVVRIAEAVDEPFVAAMMPTLEPIDESIPEPIAAPVAEPIVEPVLEPAAQIAAEVAQPSAEAVPEPAPAPIAVRVIEPVVASAPEPLVEPVLEPAAEVAEPITQPTPEVNPEPMAPISEPIAEPALEPDAPIAAEVSQPIAESIPEPIPSPIVEPVADPEPAPIAGQVKAPVMPPAPESIVESADPVESEPFAPARVEVPQPEPVPIAASIAPSPDPQSAPGGVLPMTRTVRIEVTPRTAVASRAASTDIERLLRIAAARGAGALFLTSDSRPWIRVEGGLRQLDSEVLLSRADIEGAIMEIAPESGHESIGKGVATEWIAEFTDVGRVRCTTFADHHGPGVLLRMIATRTATAEQLGLAREIEALATESQGLVLVAGPRASGKSTLVSALVDLVNRQRAEFVITLERQVRLVHENKAALVSQREIRGSADDSVAAAQSALRENPDVIVVDDLVSAHMIPLLLTAASEGLLVIVAMTAPSTADAVQLLIELAPPEMRKAVQAAMAESFRGAVGQVLLKKAGGGLVAAREVLLATAPVTRVINEGQLGQLPLALEGGRKYGMVSFTDALVDFVRAGTVDVREAFRKAPDRDRLLESLKRNGIDISVVERLA